MKIYIGTDHKGYQMRNALVEHLKNAGYEIADEGDREIDPNDDFPVFAARVVNAMRSSEDTDPRGILLCGSGQGMCMTANRFKGIRAALLYDKESARSSRNDDDSNIACIPAKMLQTKEAIEVIDTWLRTPFAGSARFVRRIKEMDEL